MRKFTLLLLIVVGTLVAMPADLKDPVIIQPPHNQMQDDGGFVFIPASENGGNPGFYITNSNHYSNEETQSFTIYDDNIEIVKELTVNLIPRTEKIYKQEKQILSLTYIGYEETGSKGYKGMDIETFVDQLKKYFGDQVKVTNLPTGEEIIALNYLFSDKFGDKYPLDFYILSDDPAYEGYWFMCEADYDTIMGFDPNAEIKESTYTNYDDVTNLIIIPETGGDSGWYALTKGIFSKDYTYILPIPEEVPFSVEHEDYKLWGTKTKAKGFLIYDINNNLLQSIYFPSGYYNDMYYDNSINYVILSEKKYLFIRTENADDTESFVLIYRLDGTGKAAHILTAPAGKISPRSPRKGETVTVEIDDSFSNETCLVNVYSSDGRNIIQKTINPGEKNVTFSTDGLTHGIYVVNVTGKAGNIESAKIIVH